MARNSKRALHNARLQGSPQLSISTLILSVEGERRGGSVWSDVKLRACGSEKFGNRRQPLELLPEFLELAVPLGVVLVANILHIEVLRRLPR